VHATHLFVALAHTLIDLTGAMDSPRQNDVLLEEAGTSFDRALFPLLVRVGISDAIGVAKLARLDDLGLPTVALVSTIRVREAVIT